MIKRGCFGGRSSKRTRNSTLPKAIIFGFTSILTTNLAPGVTSGISSGFGLKIVSRSCSGYRNNLERSPHAVREGYSRAARGTSGILQGEQDVER